MSAWKQRESRLSPASSLPAAEDSCFVSRRRFSDGVHFSKSQARLGECKESRNVDYVPDNRRNRFPMLHLGVRTRATGSAGESEGASERGSDSDGARHGRAETRMPSREQYKKVGVGTEGARSGVDRRHREAESCITSRDRHGSTSMESRSAYSADYHFYAPAQQCG